MKATPALITLYVLLVVIPACSLGNTAHSVDPPGLTSTSTVEAAAVLDSSGATVASTGTLGSSFTPAISLTATSKGAQVTVASPTKCRTGPDAVYPRLYTLQPGKSVQVIGRYTAGNYWIINIPSGGSCWLSGESAVVTGSLAGLLEYLPPPTPTPALPAAPTGFHVTFACSQVEGSLYSTVHVEMSWNDEATNEDGYYIYRNGSLLATLERDRTTYSDDTSMATSVPIGSPRLQVIYSVQAFNRAGTSTKVPKSISCAS